MPIRRLEERDWPAVKAIFEEGLATGAAAFETRAPSWQEWDGATFLEPACAGAPLNALPPRGAGGDSAPWPHQSAGSGMRMERLVRDSEEAGYRTLLAGIFPQHEASVELHRRLGFRVLGKHERLGRLSGEWRDVLLLERRSA